jgi:formate dehydrogenase
MTTRNILLLAVLVSFGLLSQYCPDFSQQKAGEIGTDVVVINEKSFDPIKVVRVCESLTCELFGSQKILKDLKIQDNKNIKIVPGPCMGRCDVAPTVCVGKNYVDHATAEKVIETINKNDT